MSECGSFSSYICSNLEGSIKDFWSFWTFFFHNISRDHLVSFQLNGTIKFLSYISLNQYPYSLLLLGDHSSIMSSKRWVGGVRKWQFSTVNHQIVGWVGLKKSKTWWRNTWRPPSQYWAPKHHKQWHLTTGILIIAPWWLSARHSFIDSKCRPWSHKSDKNPPEEDIEPPGDNNPWNCCSAVQLIFYIILYRCTFSSDGTFHI